MGNNIQRDMGVELPMAIPKRHLFAVPDSVLVVPAIVDAHAQLAYGSGNGGVIVPFLVKVIHCITIVKGITCRRMAAICRIVCTLNHAKYKFTVN